MIIILILSIIQGVTEFLPISSSSHLIVVSNYFNFEAQKLNIDIGLHIGSFLAILFFFRKEILNFYKNKDIFLKIFLASIPVMIAGYLLVKFDIIYELRNIKVIGWTTLVFGILLYLSDKRKMKKQYDKDLNYKTALLIGLTQILSLIPGVSRSGITITSARFLCYRRLDAAKISFLLSIPSLAAVTVYGLNELFNSENLVFSILMLYSIIFSFIFSLITIIYFLKFIVKFNLNIFVFYRIVLGIILLNLAYSQ